MAEAFDPYYIWLGIPPEEQPADHYRLLGVRRFESNEEVIANAADQRVRHLRSMQTGKRQAETQKLLNEIALAAATLLDPDKKQRYDDTLRNKDIAAQSLAMPPAPPRIGRAPDVETSSNLKLPTHRLALAGTLVACVVLALLVSAWAYTGKTKQETAGAASTSNGDPGGPATLPNTQPATPAPSPVPTPSPATRIPPAAAPPVQFAPFTSKDVSELAWVGGFGWKEEEAVKPTMGVMMHRQSGLVHVERVSNTFEYRTTQPASIFFRNKLSSSYVIELTATRLEGEGPFAFDFVLAGKRCRLILDGYKELGYRSGLDMISGHLLSTRTGPAVHQGALLPLNVPTQIKIAVHEEDIVGTVEQGGNIRTFLSWQGNAALGCGRDWDPPDYSEFKLAIHSKESRWFLQNLTLYPLRPKPEIPGASGAIVLKREVAPVPSPVPEVSRTPAHSGNWEYGYGRIDMTGHVIDFRPLVHSATDAGAVLWGTEAKYPAKGTLNYLNLDQHGGHPCGDPGIVVIRRWKHPQRAMIELRGEMEHPHTEGDGVSARLITGKGLSLWEAKVKYSKVAISTKPFVLESNESLDLCVDCNAEPFRDFFRSQLSLSVRLAGISNNQQREAWDSIADFRLPSPPPTGSPPAGAPAPAAASGSPELQKAARLSMPTETALTSARAKLKETFGDVAAKSKRPEEKLKLVGEMRSLASSEKDPTIRYAALDAARRLAMAGQDTSTALQVTGEIARLYETDPLDQQLQTLKLAVGTMMPPAAWEEASGSAMALAETGRDTARVELADRASLLAVDFAAKGKNLEQRKEAKRVRDTVLAYKKSATLVQEAEATLKTKPDDAAANLVVGKWRCFVLEDWKEGLPYLEKCGETALTAAALAEKDPKNSLAIADVWYAALNNLQGADRSAAQRRAQSFYAQAAKDLTGLDQLRAGKRADELQSVTGEKTAVKAASSPVIAADAKLEPGLIVRIVSGSQAIPTPILGTSMNWDGIVWDNVEVESRKVLELRGISASPLATGYIELDTDDTVVFTLRNAYCLINGTNFPPLVAVQKGEEPSYFGGRVEAKFEKQLTKGRHTLVIGRIPINTGIGTEFRVKRKGGGDCVFHSPKALEAELTKSVRLPGGGTSKGILLFGNLKFSR